LSGTGAAKLTLILASTNSQADFKKTFKKAFPVMQTQRRLSDSGQTTATILQTSELKFSETHYPARLKMPAHQHGLASFSFVLAGGYTESLGRRQRECKPLSSVYHPQGESHSVVFHQSNARIFRVEFSDGWRSRVQDFAPFLDQPAEFNGGLLAFLTMRLFAEIQRNDQWAALSVEGLMLEIAAELGRARDSLKSSGKSHWVERIKEMLSSRLSENISLVELAESAGVHPVHLSREFRKRFHCTIGDYLRRLRIEQACAALINSDAPMSEIALAAGFYDQSHFSNTFKKITGMTPAAWRAASGQCRNA